MLYTKQTDKQTIFGNSDAVSGGDWRPIGGIGVRANDAWRCVGGVYKKINGVWTEVWPKAKSTTIAVPSFSHTTADDGTQSERVVTDEAYYYLVPHTTITVVYTLKYSTHWSGEFYFHIYGAHVSSYKFASTNGSPTTYVKSSGADSGSNCDTYINFSGNDWNNTGATETLTITADPIDFHFEIYTSAAGRISATGKVTYSTYRE